MTTPQEDIAMRPTADIPTPIERAMLQNRVEEALFLRRRALHRLRLGDRLGHKHLMVMTRLPLLQAREWKRKQ